ncbi:MAG: SiaB family protein kinase, partial [Bacteroidales bacterium]|nr:SiaB family protein kinase [Bacteroidales bacterium]
QDILKDKLDHINSLSPEELNDFCRDIRLTTGFTEKSGASLGLIEMAKKSGNKLVYSMKPVDDQKTYFYLSTEELTQNETSDCDYEYSLNDIIETHDFLRGNNITLSFKGDFNQDNLLSLLSILNNGMNESPVRIKLFSIMVELLQNIVKHADNLDADTGWKAGVFYICEQNDRFRLIAGNYIKRELADDLRKRFDRINGMNAEELNAEYKSILFNLNYINPVSTGLGIIDIRRKSGGKVDYSLININNTIDFLTVKVDIKKQV